MTEDQFRERLTAWEKHRLAECAKEIAACAEKGAFSFMAYWAEQIRRTLEGARERMAEDDGVP